MKTLPVFVLLFACTVATPAFSATELKGCQPLVLDFAGNELSPEGIESFTPHFEGSVLSNSCPPYVELFVSENAVIAQVAQTSETKCVYSSVVAAGPTFYFLTCTKDPGSKTGKSDGRKRNFR